MLRTLCLLLVFFGAALTVKAAEPLPTAQPMTENAKIVGKPAKSERRFIDHGEYIEDTKTKLLWQKSGLSGKRNFAEAAEYASTLQLDLLGNWRVPTVKELQEIFDAREKLFEANECCKGDELISYWTGDRDDQRPDYAFIFQWDAKAGASNRLANKTYCQVRCVRGPATVDELTPPDEKMLARIDALVIQLGSKDHNIREVATQTLNEEPPKVRPHLRLALKVATDDEVKSRLRSILRDWSHHF